MVEIKLNPLNVLDKRKLNFIPNHFVKAQIEEVDSVLVNNWIYENLNDRYAISYTNESKSSSKKRYLILGFENPKELTFTLLKCPYFTQRRQ